MISLRAYNREIEKFIEGGSYTEAIKHCKHILRVFPKCISTYRSLAKALLENHEYMEAKDVFARVLAVFPDDFVSHLGLSIINESEGNLNAAIWHMELAYDLQPSNPAITEELRRLFGRRDGVMPPKIRITRGALIRIYARGELYHQAISECQSALAEDPQRIDLEVMLAQMHYASGGLMESAEICVKILTHLPFCYEANRLMALILPQISQQSDTRVFVGRLIELDPYNRELDSIEMSASEVPEDAVTLERLEESVEPETPESVSWSENFQLENKYDSTSGSQASHGLEPGDYSNNNLSELETDGGYQEPGLSFDDESESQSDSLDHIAQEQEKESPFLLEDLPEWMRNAGWIRKVGNSENELDNSTATKENESNPDQTSDQGSESELSEEDIAGKPQLENDTGETPGIEEQGEQQFTPSTLIHDADQFETKIQSSDLHFAAESQNPTPIRGESGEHMSSDQENKNEDEWLNQLRGGSSPNDDKNDLPDWLKDFESESEQPLEENVDIPEWLKSLEPTGDENALLPEENPTEEAGEEESAVLSEEESESAIASTSYLFTKTFSEDETGAENLSGADSTQILPPTPETPEVKQPVVEQPSQPGMDTVEGLPAWVRNVLKRTATVEEPAREESQAANIPAEPVTPSVERVESQPQMPMEEVHPEAEIPLAESVPPPIPAMEKTVGVSEISESPIQEIPSVPSSEGAISEDTSQELLDWLRGFGEEEHPQEAPVIAEEKPVESEIAEEVTAETALDRLVEFVAPEQEAQKVPEPVSEEPASPVEEVPAVEEAFQTEAVAETEESVSEEELPPSLTESWVAEIAESEAEASIPAESEELVEEPTHEEEGGSVFEAPEVSEVEEPAMEVKEEIPQSVSPVQPEVADPIETAVSAMEQGDVPLALTEFGNALHTGSNLPSLIEALKSSVSYYENETDLWQLLGDAYARNNQFEEAFSAYDRAESILLKISL